MLIERENMESGTQVQLAETSEIVCIPSVLTPKQTSTQQQQQQIAVPRVLIVATTATPATQSGAIERKPMTVVESDSGGRRCIQNPLPSASIIIHPSSVLKPTGNGSAILPLQQANNNAPSVNTSSGTRDEPQTIHPQTMISVNVNNNPADEPRSHSRQQVMIVQAANLSSATPDIGNCQTLTLPVADSEGRQEQQAIYSTMQFVPSGEFGTEMLYAASTPSAPHHSAHHLQSGATYAVYHNDSGAYSPHVNYYQNSTIAYQQSLHSPGSTYSIPGQHGGATISVPEDDSAAQQLSHTTRASPATIQWLLQNYETAEGVSLPRCTLYGHYLKHCGEHKLDPVNAASFGKLIRSVFLGLRTRRLGTRGNSKYHYYGIRIKPDSPLNKLSDDNMTMAMRQQPSNPSRRIRTVIPNTSSHSPSSVTSTSQRTVQQMQAVPSDGNNVSDSVSPGDQHKHLLGIGMVPHIIPPSMTTLEPNLQRIGLSVVQAERFFAGYRQHCEDILDYVKNLLFNDVECCWRQFWQAEENSPLDDGEEESNRSFNDDINLTGLTRTQLYTMCTLQPVLEYIQTMDFHFYQVIADVLIPNVLKPIPSTLTQSIRNFAKRLENSLAVALQGAPEVVVKIKLDAVGSLAQTVRRYTSLNHLAQAARAVLQNPAQISQMLTDLNRVDFRNVQEQASWVCYCNSSLVEDIEKNFKLTLENQKNLEEWASWLESVVDQVLSTFCARPYHELIHFSRQFLLKWSFYSSMVMRDLTLRSAPSFGSFHLIRLLFDEYMFYLIEQRVARATGQTTVAIMSQSYRHHIELAEMNSYHTNDFSEAVISSHNHHHSEPLEFTDQYHMVSSTNVAGDETLLNADINSSSQVNLEQQPSSVEVDGYLQDSANEYFIATSTNSAQESIDSVATDMNANSRPLSQTQPPSMPNEISAVNTMVDESSLTNILPEEEETDELVTSPEQAAQQQSQQEQQIDIVENDEPDVKRVKRIEMEPSQ